MMFGEAHRPNPTINVPPWPNLDDDQTAEVHSPLKYNNSNPFYMQEALGIGALQRNITNMPSNEPDPESDSELLGLDGSPDSPVDAHSSDQFRMFEFKVRRCARGRAHDWTDCPYAHPGEKARRRDPRMYHYCGTVCPDFKNGNCRKGDACEFAHGVFECWLHPARYRTQPCKDGTRCRRRVCFFAHTPDQLRVVSSVDSIDGSPSSAKTLSFWSSSGSGSPPMSSGAGSSPPFSPMSRSLCSASINETLASLRNMQLGKVKSLPCSWNVWNVQDGCCSPSAFESPRGAVVRPGFCSLPSTPTQNLTRPGTGYLDFWDEVYGEEPHMERVESGRGLREKMFEKLSKDNSFERANSSRSFGDPNVDWVSDLVK